MIQVETEADHEFILANCKGMKIMFNQSSLAENQIQKIRACIEYNQLKNGSGGFTELKIDHSYRDKVFSPIRLRKPLKVVIGCNNEGPARSGQHCFKSWAAMCVLFSARSMVVSQTIIPTQL
jgi:hypothetical protein